MPITHYFAGLARYHAWATGKLLAQDLAALSDEEWHRHGGLFFSSVHGTLNHLLVTDSIWYARLAEGRSPRIPLEAELHTARAPLTQALGVAAQRWAPWLSGVDPARFDGELAYHRNNGESVRLPFTPVLGHVFNHATHHRGQLSAAITAMGHAGPRLDWIQLLQQESRSA